MHSWITNNMSVSDQLYIRLHGPHGPLDPLRAYFSVVIPVLLSV
jgi:hypothetical protein